MDKETETAIKKTIVYLDSIMETSPSQRVADASNTLEDVLDGNL